MKWCWLCLKYILIFSVGLAACSPVSTPPPPAGASPAASVPIAEKARPGNQGWEAIWQDKVALAKKEGEILVYSIPGAETRAALTRGFKERYGINLAFVAGRGGELTEKISRERATGIYLADAIIGGGTTLLISVKPKGFLQSLEQFLLLPEVTDPKIWRTERIPFLDADKTAIGMKANYTRYVSRNTELVRENEITSYRDLLHPKWKGKIIMADPTEAGAGSSFPALLAENWGLEEAKDYLRQLVKLEPVVTKDKRLHVETVARGKYHVGIAIDQENVAMFVKMGAPISQVVVAEGGKLSSGAGALGVPKNTPHPNATLVFVNWLLTKEGQEVFNEGFITPSSRLDASTEGISEFNFARPGEKVIVESEEHYKLQEKMIPVTREIFSSLLK